MLDDYIALAKIGLGTFLVAFLATYFATHSPPPREVRKWLNDTWVRVEAARWRRVPALVLSAIKSLLVAILKGIAWILVLPCRLIVNVVRVAWSWGQFRQDIGRDLGSIREQIAAMNVILAQLRPTAQPPASPIPGPSDPPVQSEGNPGEYKEDDNA